MRKFLITLFILILPVVTSAQTVPVAAPDPPAEDARIDAHLLRVENVRLRAALAQVQAELEMRRLTEERATLVETLRRERAVPATWTFDWTTKQFVDPDKKP